MGGAAVAGLLEVLESGKTYEAQCAAAGALGEIKDRAAVPGLLKALKSSNLDLLRHSANALTKIGWLPQTEEEKILYYGARQNWDELVKIGRASAVVLLESLSADNEDVRLGAEATLVKIGIMIVPELLEALRADQRTVRVSVIRVLGKLQEPRAIPGLLEALKEKDPYLHDIREAAAEALGETGDARAIPGLTDALKDPNADVCWLAAEAIEKIEDAAFIKCLGKASPIPDLLVALRKAQREARAKRAREEKEQWATLPRRNCSATPFKYGPLYAEYNSISDTLFKLGHSRGGFRYELVLKEAAHGKSDADGESHYYPDQYEWVKTPRASLGSVTEGTH